MTYGRTLSAMVVLMSLAAAPAAPTSAPSSLEVRANTAFNNGQYALALPLLQKLANQYKDQSDKLGPIKEEIRVCNEQITQANAANGLTPPTPQAPVSLSAGRKPHEKPKDGEVLDMQIKDLGNFDYDADKGGNIPKDVQDLTGSTIKLHGFMIPIDQAENITQFALVPSLFACCFGQPPQIQHTIVCKAPVGKAISYYPDELVVEGKLKVDEKKDDGFIVSIFELDVSSVKPAVK